MCLSAAVTKCHRLESVDHNNLFLKVPESESVMSRGFGEPFLRGFLWLADGRLTRMFSLGREDVLVSLQTLWRPLIRGSTFMILSKWLLPKSLTSKLYCTQKKQFCVWSGRRQVQSWATCSSDTMQRTEMVHYSPMQERTFSSLYVHSLSRENRQRSVCLWKESSFGVS